MRIFKEPNTSNNWVCPICKTADKKETVLVAIAGTASGNIAEAQQIHLDCVDLIYDKDHGILFQRVSD